MLVIRMCKRIALQVHTTVPFSLALRAGGAIGSLKGALRQRGLNAAGC